jgi:hypothetical protein
VWQNGTKKEKKVAKMLQNALSAHKRAGGTLHFPVLKKIQYFLWRNT